ncbi:MAG: tetratricopeptide repeat protein [Sandaracinaceae bacterium]|nr:tetratricopeptide repeat protein [Sandaracinaceae bacterium]
MRIPLRVLALAALLLVPRAALAQQNDSQLDEAARLTFESGREAFAAGDYETALSRFRQAYDLSHRPGLLYNIAQTLDRLRRDQETLDTLRQYLAAAPDAPNRSEVESRIRVLEQAIAHNRPPPPVEGSGSSTPPSRPPLHPAFFIAAAGVAVAAGALTIWTGLETLSLDSAYRAESDYDRALALYNDANTFQALTNVLWISSAVFAAGAVAMLFFTDWGAFGGGSDRQVSFLPTFIVTPQGAALGAQLRF